MDYVDILDSSNPSRCCFPNDSPLSPILLALSYWPMLVGADLFETYGVITRQATAASAVAIAIVTSFSSTTLALAAPTRWPHPTAVIHLLWMTGLTEILISVLTLLASLTCLLYSYIFTVSSRWPLCVEASLLVVCHCMKVIMPVQTPVTRSISLDDSEIYWSDNFSGHFLEWTIWWRARGSDDFLFLTTEGLGVALVICYLWQLFPEYQRKGLLQN